MRIRLVIGTLVLAAAISDAQELKPQTGTGVVSGRVISAPCDGPISGAHVRLRTVNPPIGFASTYFDAITEANGGFSFAGVPAGTIQLTANLDGYLEGRVGQRRPNGDGVSFVWLKRLESLAGSPDPT